MTSLTGRGRGNDALYAALNVLLFFGLVVLERPGITGRQLQLALGGQTGLQLATSFEFGVQFGAEQQSQVGDPQPQQKDDDPSPGFRRWWAHGSPDFWR